jgi:hypothetical protein
MEQQYSPTSPYRLKLQEAMSGKLRLGKFFGLAAKSGLPNVASPSFRRGVTLESPTSPCRLKLQEAMSDRLRPLMVWFIRGLAESGLPDVASRSLRRRGEVWRRGESNPCIVQRLSDNVRRCAFRADLRACRRTRIASDGAGCYYKCY